MGELFFHKVHCSQTECIILPSILFSCIVSKVVVCLSAFFIWLSLSTSGAPFSHFSCRHVHLWREKSQQMTVHLLSCRQGWCFSPLETHWRVQLLCCSWHKKNKITHCWRSVQLFIKNNVTSGSGTKWKCKNT